jgi:hypothetical protein
MSAAPKDSSCQPAPGYSSLVPGSIVVPGSTGLQRGTGLYRAPTRYRALTRYCPVLGWSGPVEGRRRRGEDSRSIGIVSNEY